jgi:hypothetical protein
MLIIKPQVRIISREVALPSGELVRAFFALIDIQGVIEVKFLGTKPISENIESNKILLLDCPKKTVCNTPVVSTFYETVYSFNTLDLLVNQLARAPSMHN